jgi:membrane complex biogenesis BtpA family protein
MSYMQDMKDLFGVDKPIIAMAHLPALPGTPLYDDKAGVNGIIDWVASDVEKLLRGGVDAILFCNESDRPYALKADFEAVAVMSRVVTECAPKDRPFGVDFMWDGRAAIAVAHATGAQFVREVFSGVYESDMGLWNTDPAAIARYRHNIGADNVKLYYNVTPEFASSLGTRSVGMLAKSAAVSCMADAILVAGPMAGTEPKISWVVEAKQAVGELAPVLLNTGARLENLHSYLPLVDGVIVGSSLKVDGYTWNRVDEVRVRTFMDAAKVLREQALAESVA